MHHATHPLSPEQQDLAAQLYLRLSDRVLRQVAAALRPADEHLAEDLAQDVWLDLLQYLRRGNTVASPAGLLASMARHRVADHYRSARVRREALVDFAEPGQERRVPAAASAEAVALAAAAVRELVAA
ncbi:RNA polymerase sigma factor [Streptomyces sp. NPDC001380]|uniref:RNA polymerase sigma factor n=1 Tax=Streptomyces sp. NPDC001380 TaxID=3364566 RepID=UPI0036BB3B27